MLRTTLCGSIFSQRSASAGRSFQFLSTLAPRIRFKSIELVDDGESFDIAFNDGSAFRFHSIWLRDACRDEKHLLPSMERNVNISAVVAGVPANVKAQSMQVDSEMDCLTIHWPGNDVVRKSSLDALLLRAYAPRVAMALDGENGPWIQPSVAPTSSWLDPFDSSIEPPRAMDPSGLLLLSNRTEHENRVPVVPYEWVGENHETFLRAITDPGCVIVDGMPEDAACDGSVISDFVSKYLGGLQKHPLRDNAHWTISTEESVQISNSAFTEDKEQLAASNSYNTKLQLANHTDQALYGTPGLLLLFHCAMGEGNNSLVDGFAAAFALRERRPDLYAMLSRYGANAGRRLSYYKNGVMSFNVSKPVIQTDANGDPIRIQYHEMYRTPLQVPYDDMRLYYEALQTWYNMTHSDEFQMHFKLQKGQMIIMNNWRMMHGRAGLEGKKRIILGGTVTRDAFYSRARFTLADKYGGLAPREEVGLPIDLFPVLAGAGLPRQRNA